MWFVSSQLAASSTWSKPSHNSFQDSWTTYPLILKIGPYRLAQVGFSLTICDLGPTAISGVDIDIKSLPAQKALLLKSAPDRLVLALSSFTEKMLVYPFYRYDRSWVATKGDFDTYFGSFSKISRKGLRRRTKKLADLSGGHIDLRRFDQSDQMGTFHADARAVSAKTFQEQLMNDGLPADPSFLDAMIHRASAGQCYGTILYLNDQPISYLYCERQGAGWLASYGGFDPAHAGLSPGTVHLFKDLEEAFNDAGCAFFDLGPGQCDYKKFFSTHNVPCSDILILNKTIANRLTIGVHRSLESTEIAIDLANSLKLKERLRQKIRGR